MSLNPKLMEETVSLESQHTIRYRAYYNAREVKPDGDVARRLRVTIRSNFYTDQCSAEVAMYVEGTWHPVADLASGQMKTETGLSSRPKELKPTAQDFAADRDTLLRLAATVINGTPA